MGSVLISRLFKVASEIAQKKGMPYTFIEEWKVPKSVSNKQACRVVTAAYKAELQCNEWANEIRSIIDAMLKARKSQESVEVKPSATFNIEREK